MTKEEWSIPTWFFFHGFAARINEEFYANNYIDCWNKIIKNICNSLPCPVCKYHANLYISNINYNEINTKDKLKRYLFTFHNKVNKRLNKNNFEYSNLEIYKRLKMSRVYTLMHNAIIKEYYGSKVLNSWYRRKNMSITLNYLLKIWKNID
jgi:hypothetical protein